MRTHEFATNYADLFRRAAAYGEKVLTRAITADLTVAQPAKFEFIVNLKAAKQIGLAMPPNMLVSADKVIK